MKGNGRRHTILGPPGRLAAAYKTVKDDVDSPPGGKADTRGGRHQTHRAESNWPGKVVGDLPAAAE